MKRYANPLRRIEADRRVVILDDERRAGNGIIITLRRGWTFDALQDNRVAGADTPAEAAALLATATRFGGPYTD